jgi:hypothetical protein
MKPRITLLFFIICLSILSGQDQYSLLQEDAVWVQEAYHSDGFDIDTTYVKEFIISGDTILQNVTYSKVFMNGSFFGGLREENKRLLFSQYGQLDTLIDFNLSVGDTFIIVDYSPGTSDPDHYMMLHAIDTIDLADGSSRKRFQFNGFGAGNFIDQNFEAVWIDGLGSSRGIIPDEQCGILPPERSFSPTCRSHLTCYQLDGQVLFSGRTDPIYSCTAEGVVSDTEEVLPSGALNLFPNPASETVTLSLPFNLDLTDWQYRVVDAFGRVVSQPKQVRNHQESITVSHLPAGMYRVVLQSGQQVLARSVVVTLD